MKLHRKLFISVMTMLLLVTTFTTSTFAWFKINSNANVEGFDFKVVGGEGFLISVDNENFTNDLTNEELYKAILLKLDNNLIIEDKKLVDTLDNNKVLTNDDITEKLKSIKLFPVTSSNGYEFTDLHGSKQSPATGRFIEFDVYLKAASSNLEDERVYDISLLIGNSVTNDVLGKEIQPTKFTSDVDNITLAAPMITIKNPSGLSKGAQVSVHSANAMRFSIEEESEETVTINNQIIEKEALLQNPELTEEQKTSINAEIAELRNSLSAIPKDSTIYEFYDANDLGSYATKYLSSGNNVSVYDSTKNAMFTYYNNLKLTDIEALDINKLPKTVRYDQANNKLSTAYSQLIENSANYDIKVEDLTEAPVITRISSGNASKKLTIRVWLEGWDADCFDGLAKSISINLTFTSKKVVNS